MFQTGALVLYKNRPALVLAPGDRIQIRTGDGAESRVRDKDLVLLHPGPVRDIPPPAPGGDFETARTMLAAEGALPEKDGWMVFAELVFGTSTPPEVMACWRESVDGTRFRIEDGRPRALEDAEYAAELERRTRKAQENSDRERFIARARALSGTKRARGQSGMPAPTPEDETPDAGDARFLAELESCALGRNPRSRLAAEIGIKESPEAIHAYLVARGHWEPFFNPHPVRSNCSLRSPVLPLEPDRTLPGSRTDLTGLESWAIDNAWSHDPDDAIAWDGEHVWVHVADPAACILPGSPVDVEALGRGATLYLPELTSTMLPAEALDRFGLGLAERSPALSFRMTIDEAGFITGCDILPSIVRVRRTNYAEADGILEAGSAVLGMLDRIARMRRARRIENGAVEIDIPEVRVHADASTGRATVDRIARNRSSAMVREFMVLAGEAAAGWAFRNRIAFPFSGQESPNLPREAVPGDESLSIQFARRRGMKAMMLGPTLTAHRGLGLPYYAQVTSPLRRYQDLLGHMQIHAFLEGREPLDADEVARRCALAQAATAPNRAAERASELHWTLVRLLQETDWNGDAMLLSATGPGFWSVYIPDLGMESRIRLSGTHSPDESIRVRASRIDIPSLESAFEAI